jgi:hypothetical protein
VLFSGNTGPHSIRFFGTVRGSVVYLSEDTKCLLGRLGSKSDHDTYFFRELLELRYMFYYCSMETVLPIISHFIYALEIDNGYALPEIMSGGNAGCRIYVMQRSSLIVRFIRAENEVLCCSASGTVPEISRNLKSVKYKEFIMSHLETCHLSNSC